MPPDKKPRAYSLDLDGTIIGRGRIATQLNVPHGMLERFSLKAHSTRHVMPGVKDYLETASSGGVDIFINTGRPNKKDWVDMTNETLRMGQIDRLIRAISFTPVEIPSMLSKAAAVRELTEDGYEVSHFEDDPTTAILLAGLFPQARVYLVQHARAGLLFSSQELAQFPNLRRIGLIQEAL